MQKAQPNLKDDIRWCLFKRKLAQVEGVPPTKGALIPALQRAHYQVYIAIYSNVARPGVLDPKLYTWELEDDKWKAFMCNLPPPPILSSAL